MPDIELHHDELHIGRLRVAFHRTLRIPDDGRAYPLPPGLGAFPLHRVEDHADRVPERWRDHGGVFLPMYQREAMWISLDAPDWHPAAVKVAAGMVNAVSGGPWDEEIRAGRAQDYLVSPPQPWLDGINAGPDVVRQFVAMPLGMGYTVEAQVTGREEHGGLQILALAPRPGLFPDEAPVAERVFESNGYTMASASPPREMGLAAGGRMRQKVYPDPHGPQTWDPASAARLYVHIVDSVTYEAITGRPAPSSPVEARTYTAHGLPWFDLYDERLGDLPPSEVLARVRSVRDRDRRHGFRDQQDDRPVEVPEAAVRRIPVRPRSRRVADGRW